MQTHIDVSIPLLSGPVLNVVPVRFCDVAHCLNPFAFRASAEPPFGPRIEGGGRRLNPFAFRASAERARQPGLYIFHRLNPFAFRASAERGDRRNMPFESVVSIPLLSGPGVNKSGETTFSPSRVLNPFAFRASAELADIIENLRRHAVSIPL